MASNNITLIIYRIFIQVLTLNKHSKGPNLRRVGSDPRLGRTKHYQMTLFCLTYDLKYPPVQNNLEYKENGFSKNVMSGHIV